MIGRNRDWGRAVEALPLPDRVRTLALAGFSGVWIDRWGYTGEPRPRFEALERELAVIAGEAPLVSSSGRYSFVDIRPFQASLVNSLRRCDDRQLRTAAHPAQIFAVKIIALLISRRHPADPHRDSSINIIG